MIPTDLLELVRRRPFVPIRIHTTDGQSYEVRHPERIIVLPTRAIVPIGGDDGFTERVEHVAIAHVVRIEDLAESPSN